MGARGALVGTRVVWRRTAARAVTFSLLFRAGSARRWLLLSKARWGPLRSIQFGVRKIDGFLWDLEFVSLEGFFVNKGEKWKCVKMKTEWEEISIMCGLRLRTQEVTLNCGTNGFKGTVRVFQSMCVVMQVTKTKQCVWLKTRMIVISNFIFYFKKQNKNKTKHNKGNSKFQISLWITCNRNRMN